MRPPETIKGGFTMNDDFELIRGSVNVFHDFGRPNAGLEQARAVLAAEVIRALDVRGLLTREAERLTGISHSEFSRIRNARLDRFTLDRMIAILGKLDEDVEVKYHPLPLHFGKIFAGSNGGKTNQMKIYLATWRSCTQEL